MTTPIDQLTMNLPMAMPSAPPTPMQVPVPPMPSPQLNYNELVHNERPLFAAKESMPQFIPEIPKEIPNFNMNLVHLCFINLIVHNPGFQKILQNNIPSLYNNGKNSLLSTIFTTAIFIVLFLVSQKVNIKIT